MKRKYQKTQGYWVYSHTTPNGMVYFGVSKLQPCRRWQKETYKGKSLEPFLESWDLMEHVVIKDGLDKKDAYALEDWYIQNTPNCINKQRSGFVCSDIKEYMREYMKQHYSTIEYKEQRKQYYQEHKEEIKEHMKQYYQNNRQKRLEYQNQYRAKKKS